MHSVIDPAEGNLSADAKHWLAALEDSLSGSFTLTTTTVALPTSGRQYVISLPAEQDHGRLSAEAKGLAGAEPPHWARIWSSGLALADLALARRVELAGRRVLELGSGLGVTATAAIDAGADLVAADYSPQALSFCRYNALSNTGRAPRLLHLDWRAPDEAGLSESAEADGFSVILAADVLYDSRDITPLRLLIDRWLAADGVFWLVEPARRTAQRFLYRLALDGWIGETERVDGPWSAGLGGPVYLHRLQRPAGADPLRSSLAGWRG